MAWGFSYKPYVPVGQRRAEALLEMNRLRKKGANIQPVEIDGRTIANSFWGKSWCDHLEKFSDFENRLPRGRTYVRNGSVCHLEVGKGKVSAKVSGSEIYDVTVSIKALPEAKWQCIRESCGGKVGSMLELLQGRLSSEVMGIVTNPEQGLFPLVKEIDFDCSCPDWASMCKHIAAVLYGIGSRLDKQPEMLFLLRGVDHTELVGTASAEALVAKGKPSKTATIKESDLGEVFGIDVAPAATDAKVANSKPLNAGRKQRGVAGEPTATSPKIISKVTTGPAVPELASGNAQPKNRKPSQMKKKHPKPLRPTVGRKSQGKSGVQKKTQRGRKK
ncbi:MAG: SWIM zinc finger family protein [Rhodanobacteraceae bacterium]